MTSWCASELGLRSIEHSDTFFSAMARADPGPVQDWSGARVWWRGEEGAAALRSIAANGTYVVPTQTIIAHGAERLRDG